MVYPDQTVKSVRYVQGYWSDEQSFCRRASITSKRERLCSHSLYWIYLNHHPRIRHPELLLYKTCLQVYSHLSQLLIFQSSLTNTLTLNTTTFRFANNNMYQSREQNIDHIRFVLSDTAFKCMKCGNNDGHFTSKIVDCIGVSQVYLGESFYTIKCKRCERPVNAADAYHLAQGSNIFPATIARTDRQLASHLRLWICPQGNCGAVNVPQTQAGVFDAEDALKPFIGSQCRACLNDCNVASACFEKTGHMTAPTPAPAAAAPKNSSVKRKLGEIADSIADLGRRVRAKFEDRPLRGNYYTPKGPSVPSAIYPPAPAAALPASDEPRQIVFPDPSREIAMPAPRRKAKFLNEKDAFQMPVPVPNLSQVPYPRAPAVPSKPAAVPGTYLKKTVHSMPQIRQAETLPPVLRKPAPATSPAPAADPAPRPALRLYTQVDAPQIPPPQIAPVSPMRFDHYTPYIAREDFDYVFEGDQQGPSPLVPRHDNVFHPNSGVSMANESMIVIDTSGLSPVSPMEEYDDDDVL